MRDIHDERSIPLDPQPESRSLLDSIRFYLVLALSRRNRREAAQAKAAAKNAPLREAEARRKLSQPGVSPEALAKAERVFARIGNGKPQGFACVAALPVMALACVAILFALAVLL